MSDENKDLGEEAKDAMDNAKKKASDFAAKAEAAAKDFKDNVKETFSSDNPDNGKTVAIIAHLTLIGWIIAIMMNNGSKTELGSYYIRQTLGIYSVTLLLSFIPIVGCFAGIIGLVLVVMSVINAAGEKMLPTPLVGEYFQDWFKGL